MKARIDVTVKAKFRYPIVFLTGFLAAVLLYCIAAVPYIFQKETVPIVCGLCLFVVLLCFTPWIGLYIEILAVERFRCSRLCWGICELSGTLCGVLAVWVFYKSDVWIRWYQPYSHIGDPMSESPTLSMVCMAMTIYAIASLLIRAVFFTIQLPMNRTSKQLDSAITNNE